VGAAGEPELAERAATIVDSTPAAKARQQLGGADTDRARALERSEATQGYERQARQTRWIRRGLIAAGVLVLLILASVFTSQWISKQYFVANEANTVAIYRGVNQQVAWLKLSTAVELSAIPTPSLPELTQGQVLAGIAATDLSDARAIVERLRGEAASCAVATPPAGCPTSQPIPAPTLTPRFVTPTPTNTITG
jgi:protein phosphatase